MTNYNVNTAKHATLTGTTADRVKIAASVSHVEIHERTGTNPLYVTWRSGQDPTTPVGAADDTLFVRAGGSLRIFVGQAEQDNLVANIHVGAWSATATPTPCRASSTTEGGEP